MVPTAKGEWDSHLPIFISPITSPIFLNQTHSFILHRRPIQRSVPMADNTDNRRAIWGVPEKLQLHIAMLTLQFGYAGFHVVSRAALNMGISKLVFPVYRNIIALLLLLPFAYFLEKYSFKNPISIYLLLLTNKLVI